MELDSLYQEVILDHYKNPLHKRLESNYSAQVHHVNPSCGDEITLNVLLSDGIVERVSWEGVGCSISQASTSIVSDLMIGKSLDGALVAVESFSALMSSKGTSEGDEDILEDGVALAGVSKFPARIKCALLGWMAFKDAVLQSSVK
ncbi:MAG: SUF system NifU family Fe-S cluster assembly protein [Actinomycetota bacterium]|jgi:nitrogen fixation protein NifU and related proteins|tara:strand:- start:17606 stop:18043 length:438 start_codon:yes stop_codon:yes gene_type:complete